MLKLNGDILKLAILCLNMLNVIVMIVEVINSDLILNLFKSGLLFLNASVISLYASAPKTKKSKG